MSFLSSLLCLLITCSAGLCDKSVDGLGTETSGFIGFDQAARTERSSSMIAKIAKERGADAMEKLVLGARKLRSKHRFLRYKKVGDMDTALKDFLSVNPTNLKEVTRYERSPVVRALEGYVGDRKILLINWPGLGDTFHPVVELVESEAAREMRLRAGKTTGLYGVRITYLNRI